MSEIKSFRDLIAWQVGMDTVVLTYELTQEFPVEERYGLISQMRRCATSIPSNVAEGQGVRAPKWTLRHVIIAIGSSCELDTQLEVAIRLRLVTRERSKALAQSIDRVQKLLYGMRREKERRIGAVVASAGMLFFACERLFS